MGDNENFEESQLALINEIITQFSLAAIIMDAKLNVVASNPASEKFLTRPEQASAVRLCPNALPPGNMQELEQAVAEAVRSAHALPVAIDGHGDARTYIMVRPFRLQGHGLALIRVLGGAADIPALHPLWSAFFSFTPREAEIAWRLACGHCARQIAEELCLSTNTIRSHAKTLYLKTETSTQPQLAAKLLPLAFL